MIALDELAVHLAQLNPFLGITLILQALTEGLIVVSNYRMHAVLQRGRCVEQLISMRVRDQGQDTGQEAVWSVSHSYDHCLGPLIYILDFKALLDRSRAKVAVVLLDIGKEVLVNMFLGGGALVCQLLRIQANRNVPGNKMESLKPIYAHK